MLKPSPDDISTHIRSYSCSYTCSYIQAYPFSTMANKPILNLKTIG